MDGQRRAVHDVAEFYSVRAGFPLRDLPAGEVTVVGSDRRYPGAGRTVLFLALLPDRALVSTRHEMVRLVRPIVERAQGPKELRAEAFIRALSQACSEHCGDEGNLRAYEGVKLFCSAETCVPAEHPAVRRITRSNADEMIAAMREGGIPDDEDYLLADNAAFACCVEGRPVGFAGTHPVGEFSDRIGNIMIWVDEPYRRRGYGKALASATTGELLRQGRTAAWGTFADNLGAIRTAQSVGYEQYCWLLEVRFG